MLVDWYWLQSRLERTIHRRYLVEQLDGWIHYQYARWKSHWCLSRVSQIRFIPNVDFLSIIIDFKRWSNRSATPWKKRSKPWSSPSTHHSAIKWLDQNRYSCVPIPIPVTEMDSSTRLESTFWQRQHNHRLKAPSILFRE